MIEKNNEFNGIKMGKWEIVQNEIRAQNFSLIRENKLFYLVFR